MHTIRNFIREEDGVTAIEYALVAALIAVAIITAVSGAGTAISNKFNAIVSELSKA